MNASSPTTLVWLRRDLRLSDHPALTAAAEAGAVVPLFILDPETDALGAAHLWRLERSLEALTASLEAAGSRLILRRGAALDVLREVIAETGAGAVHWSRLHDRAARARDEAVKADLKDDGVAARSFEGHVLFEPWTVATGSGGFYKVYTPYWRAVSERPVADPLPAPKLSAPEAWPRSETLESLGLGRAMNRGAAVVARHVETGEAAAQARLATFVDRRLGDYASMRDRPDIAATSNLSDAFALGELSPRQAWHAAAPHRGGDGGLTFLKEVVWRDFAYHLIHHTPQIETGNWREEWDGFPWREDNEDAEAWRRGRTGVPAVDAAMRELHVTGRMHNRMRMLTASYLCKHLMTHWRVGERFFAEHLVDWDPASNAMGWQWTAGSGPDASPFFRIFNPETQGEKFDPMGSYRKRFVAELSSEPGADAMAFYEAIPRSWGLSPSDAYPAPRVDLKAGRQRALDAYAALREARAA
ncbi:MAG: deoxyribodipyrimidine photo-lyase [Pseudomonadota bacterium]